MSGDGVTTRPARIGPLLTALLAIGLIGCGAKGPKLAPVRGVVTLDGKAIAGAFVTFRPMSPGPSSMAVTGPDGRFELALSDGRRKGATVAEHEITVDLREYSAPPATADNRGRSMMTKDEAHSQFMNQTVKWIVPERYSKFDQSGLRQKVPVEGVKDCTIGLKSE
jgi:hypothetical protein